MSKIIIYVRRYYCLPASLGEAGTNYLSVCAISLISYANDQAVKAALSEMHIITVGGVDCLL